MRREVTFSALQVRNRTVEEHEESSLSRQQSYILVTGIDAPDFLKRFPIARSHTPKRPCGTAHRVGQTGTGIDARPVYRLKIREKTARWQSITLPGFFVLENNRFVRWEPQQSETTAVKSTHFPRI